MFSNFSTKLTQNSKWIFTFCTDFDRDLLGHFSDNLQECKCKYLGSYLGLKLVATVLLNLFCSLLTGFHYFINILKYQYTNSLMPDMIGQVWMINKQINNLIPKMINLCYSPSANPVIIQHSQCICVLCNFLYRLFIDVGSDVYLGEKTSVRKNPLLMFMLFWLK